MLCRRLSTVSFGSFGPRTVLGLFLTSSRFNFALAVKRPCEIPFLDVTSACSELWRMGRRYFRIDSRRTARNVVCGSKR
jgi:hypothetical protein